METEVNHKEGKEVTISYNKPTVLIGEEINPTNKKIATALSEGNMDPIKEIAINQVDAGADILDIAVSMAGIDEVSILPKVIQVVMNAVDVPLSIDSKNTEALKEALNVYKGKPLINSVTGEEKSLDAILPLVKDYGTSVIGLTVDDDGISNDPVKRVSIARKIVERAKSYDIPTEDVVIDCLTLPIGVDLKNGLVTIESVQKVKEVLGVNLTLGISNISFGMPDSTLINNTFLSIAIYHGVSCPIVNVVKAKSTVLTVDLLMGRDKVAARYIEDYKKRRLVRDDNRY